MEAIKLNRDFLLECFGDLLDWEDYTLIRKIGYMMYVQRNTRVGIKNRDVTEVILLKPKSEWNFLFDISKSELDAETVRSRSISEMLYSKVK